ncbi:MAG TPA: TonB-dependent receptor [Rhodanobacteraceae bacterium]|nr:TonB-dependent receptor [Rhodanobacteraceae bacterium]
MSGQTRVDRRVRCAGALVLLALPAAMALAQPSPQDLGNLSLEDLGQVVVTSVSKSPEPLSDAPAAIYVIGHDDIIRSGATSLAEILRLAPNLDVMQLSPSNHIVTSRGLSGNQTAQNFPNKLLVLIDGRSVYNPLFSGIGWDAQYVLPQDIERIEVISGPGAALWGANAVNGVINIITRKASDTQGGFAQVGIGNRESNASFQYGGKLGEHAYYRFYAHDFYQRAFDNSTGQNAHDGWSAPRAGFRVDWEAGSANLVTLQGDVLNGREGQGADQPDERIAGGNLMARWRHANEDGSNFQLQVYYDNERAWKALFSGAVDLNTWDIEAQHDFALGDSHHITWGIGDRLYRYQIADDVRVDGSLLFRPNTDTQNLANAFVQDQIALGSRTQATLGLKAEHDPFSGLSWMPSARLSFKPSESLLLWAAASRAVRTPTVFDEDVLEILNLPGGPVDALNGNPDYRSEKLTAYEVGLRTQWNTRAMLSASLYYNVYDDLRTLEPSPTTFFPLVFGNGMAGHTYGADIWASYSIADWWRLGAGVSIEREHLHLKPGSNGLLGAAEAGDDPGHRGFLRSSMNLAKHWTLDADLREVGALPNPHVPAYTELNVRLGWQPNDRLGISLSGFNLLHSWHVEYPGGDRIGRTVFLDTRVKF